MRSAFLSMTEARAKGLPGSDVVHRGHLQYIAGVNRDAVAMWLLRDAHICILDSFQMRHMAELVREAAEIKAVIGAPMEVWEPIAAKAVFRFAAMTHRFLDDLKIGQGIELALKARLLSKGYVLHVIDSKLPETKLLHSRQKTQPVLVKDILKCSDFSYDGERCLIPALTDKTIKFSTIVNKPAYAAALSLSDDDLKFARGYNARRNLAHLPHDEHAPDQAKQIDEVANWDVPGFVQRNVLALAIAISNESNDSFVKTRLLDDVLRLS
jgi:hypothetical protein